MFRTTQTPTAVGLHLNMPIGDDWLVNSLIPDKTLCAIYGPSKSGKSAFALQLALHIAAGKPFLGRDVRQGPVIYLSFESGSTKRERVNAVCDFYGIASDEVPFYFSETVTEWKCPVLFVIDGAGCSDEGIIRHGRSAQSDLGCASLVIHHSGREHDRGMSGVTPMLDEVDGAFTVARKGEVALVQAIKGASINASALEIPVLK